MPDPRQKLLRQGCIDLQERHGQGQQQVADASHYGVDLISMIWPVAPSKCHRKGSALTPNCVATGRQPYTAPGETTLAPVPMAIELELPPSSSIPSLAPRSASV